jgi:hypothetical protein
LKNAPLSDPTYCRQLAGLQAPGDAAAILVSSAIALSTASIALMDLSETLAPLADVPGVAQTLGGTISPDDDEHLAELLQVVER